MLYGVSAITAFAAHLLLKPWVTPQPKEWIAIAAHGSFRMGLAIYFLHLPLKMRTCRRSVHSHMSRPL